MKPLTADQLKVLFACREALISPAQGQQLLLVCCDDPAEFRDYIRELYNRYREELKADIEAMQRRIMNAAINERRMP